jgi:hypothetical protein
VRSISFPGVAKDATFCGAEDLFDQAYRERSGRRNSVAADEVADPSSAGADRGNKYVAEGDRVFQFSTRKESQRAPVEKAQGFPWTGLKSEESVGLGGADGFEARAFSYAGYRHQPFGGNRDPKSTRAEPMAGQGRSEASVRGDEGLRRVGRTLG